MSITVMGCKGPMAGHYFHTPGQRRSLDVPDGCPWEQIDGHLTNKVDRRQNSWAIHHKDGWTALAFHDYSIDSRPGSNTVVLLDYSADYDQAFAAFALAYPEWVARMFGEVEETL